MKEYNCFLDFDGTINDNSTRLYTYFVDSINQINIRDVLSQSDYWGLKKKGVNEIDWLYENYEIRIDKDKWLRRKKDDIESKNYLVYDKKFEFVDDALRYLRMYYNIVIVSVRDNRDGVYNQIEKYSLNDYISDTIIIAHDGVSKAKAIKSKYKINSEDIIIGDTEDDIISGMELGIKTFFVLTGIRDRELLNKLGLEGRVKVLNSLADYRI